MGDADRAGEIAERALNLARAHGERGHEAAALRLLADVAVGQQPPRLDHAAERYIAAAAIAEELGLRPLLARSRLGLGQAHRQAGRALEAEEHLAGAMVLFSELGMWTWLDRSEPDLRALGHLVIVARPQVNLYEYLSQKFADDPHVQVVLDRRHDGEGAPRDADRRHHQPVDHALRTRGLAVIIAR
jgi:hypothetical protein